MKRIMPVLFSVLFLTSFAQAQQGILNIRGIDFKLGMTYVEALERCNRASLTLTGIKPEDEYGYYINDSKGFYGRLLFKNNVLSVIYKDRGDYQSGDAISVFDALYSALFKDSKKVVTAAIVCEEQQGVRSHIIEISFLLEEGRRLTVQFVDLRDESLPKEARKPKVSINESVRN